MSVCLSDELWDFVHKLNDSAASPGRALAEIASNRGGLAAKPRRVGGTPKLRLRVQDRGFSHRKGSSPGVGFRLFGPMPGHVELLVCVAAVVATAEDEYRDFEP